jgi:hypothetical protein
MHDQLTNAMPGPDFLEAVADAELAQGNGVNADIYRQRAREWRQQIADLEQLQARLASMQQALDKARNALVA